MAICVRRLIEDSKFFCGDNAAFIGSSNMPPSNKKSLTTIGNLYDVLGVLFSKAKTDVRRKKAMLKRERPSDADLSKYEGLSIRFFEAMETHMTEFGEYFGSDEKESVVSKYRGTHGGSVLFRPIGLAIFTEVIARLTDSMSLEDAVLRGSLLPRVLNGIPYDGLMWDETERTVSSAHRVLIRDLLLHMAGASTVNLKERYRQKTGQEDAELPAPIAAEAAAR